MSFHSCWWHSWASRWVVAGFIIAVGAGSLLAQGSWVEESATELAGAADFDGDGRVDLVMVDRATGDYRVGFLESAGGLTWIPARGSGIPGVTGMALGPIRDAAGLTGGLVTSNQANLALTAPAANRINLFNPTRSGAPQPYSVFPSGYGPMSVVAVQVGGAAANSWQDLFVCSVYNEPATPVHLGLMRSTGSNFLNFSDVTSPVPLSLANRVAVKTGAPLNYAAGILGGSGSSTLAVYDSGAGTIALEDQVAGLPTNTLYVAGIFSGSPLATFLTWRPGETQAVIRPLIEPAAGVFQFRPAPLGQLSFGSNRIDRLGVISGPTNLQLTALFNEGAIGAVYAYDGQTTLRLIQTYQPVPGEAIQFLLPGGAGGLHVVSGVGGLSTRFESRRWGGTGYNPVMTGFLPSARSRGNGGNVAQFQFEPFVTEEPRLLSLTAAGDWSSGPVFGGSPRTLSVTNETYGDTQTGLRNPVGVNLGLGHPSAAFALVSQPRREFSFSTFDPPQGVLGSEVRIDPPAGTFNSGVCFQLTAANPSDELFYRLDGGGWTRFVPGSGVPVYAQTVVQYFGRPAGNPGARSAIATAMYRFTVPPDKIDSDEDGVPDFVEVAKGLDPKGGADSDLDGFRDLDELLTGTNPTNKLSIPPPGHVPYTTQLPLGLTVTPQPYLNPAQVSSVAGAETGTVVRVNGLNGALMASGKVASSPIAPGFVQFTLLASAGNLISLSTDEHFNRRPGSTNDPLGRELIRAFTLPAVEPVTIPFIPGSGSAEVEANRWLAGAATFLLSGPKTIVGARVEQIDTLIAALLEQKVASILQSQGQGWATNVTLFPQRQRDFDRTNPPTELLATLASPQASNSWSLPGVLQTIDSLTRTSTLPGVVNLRLLAADLYRICIESNTPTEAPYSPVLDQLRLLFSGAALSSNYLAALGTGTNRIASARVGAQALVNSAGARPRTVVDLRVRADSFGPACTVLQGSSGPVSLVNAFGEPFGFSSALELVPDSLIRLEAFSDLPADTCAPQTLEVIQLRLVLIPRANDRDLDGNLLIDSWERLFLGGTVGHVPWTDSDGDGYSDWQEMVEGTDPSDGLGRPSVAPLPLGPPSINLSLNEQGRVRLRWSWPRVYASKLRFAIRAASRVSGGSFRDVVTSALNSGDEFEVNLEAPSSIAEFYIVTLTNAEE